MNSKMKERSLILTGPEVSAILAGRKTQFRTPVKLREFQPSPTPGYDWTFRDKRSLWNCYRNERLTTELSPHGKAGDRLWIRETWGQPDGRWDEWEYGRGPANPDLPVLYHERDSDGSDDEYWRPSCQMPRWASRITLEVVNTRVERLQDLREDDALAEGADQWEGPPGCLNYRCEGQVSVGSACKWYWWLWESKKAKPGFTWDDNPMVWVVAFKLVELQIPEAERKLQCLEPLI